MPESTRHRRAFDRYFRLGSQRSLALLHEVLKTETGKAPAQRTLEEWSQRYQWQDRIAETERLAREADDEERIAAVREMQERQAREALLLQQKGAKWITTVDDAGVSAEAAIRAIVEGARLERLVRGEVTERTEIQGGDPGLGRFTDEELERLAIRLEADVGGVESETS